MIRKTTKTLPVIPENVVDGMIRRHLARVERDRSNAIFAKPFDPDGAKFLNARAEKELAEARLLDAQRRSPAWAEHTLE